MASKSGVSRASSSRFAPLRSARILSPSGESRKPHDAAIVGVSLTLDEPGTLAAIDELDCGVGSDQKIVGHLADGWTTSMIAPRYPSARNA